MPTPSTSNLPKPKSWDEFEDIVWEIYTRKWQDPHTQRYGRSGQAQKGVDIYGQQNGSGKYIAVQCKRYEDRKLSVQKIMAEVTKSESFLPLISEYLIVTTASRETKIQDSIRILNDKRKSEGKFTIHAIFWEDICSDLVHPDNHDLLKKHYREWEQIFRGQKEGEEKEKVTSIRCLLSLDIRQDCELLQELLDHNEQNYLSEKWQSCLSQNRGVWQDIESRILLSQSGEELMQHIQSFYKQLDRVEEDCKTSLLLKSKVCSLKSKPKRGYFENMHPSKGAEKYFTEADAIELINSKKANSMKLRELKEIIQIALDSGSRVINELNQ